MSSWIPLALTAVLLVALAASGCAHHVAGPGATSVEPPTPLDATHDGVSLDPFRLVVRHRILRTFERLSAGDPAYALDQMADDVEYTFEGDHALGGTRVSRAGVARWFDRLLRLLPGQFTIRSVQVVGWPWRALVYTVFEDVVRPAVGAPYRNHGVQIVELHWGTAVRIHTYVDTAKIERALRELAAAGISEAAAPPILE
jgi:ketosteroid isomerase-like protein